MAHSDLCRCSHEEYNHQMDDGGICDLCPCDEFAHVGKDLQTLITFHRHRAKESLEVAERLRGTKRDHIATAAGVEERGAMQTINALYELAALRARNKWEMGNS